MDGEAEAEGTQGGGGDGHVRKMREYPHLRDSSKTEAKTYKHNCCSQMFQLKIHEAESLATALLEDNIRENQEVGSHSDQVDMKEMK